MMRNEPDFKQYKEIEALLQSDRRDAEPTDTHIVMAELAPLIAREAALLRRRKKNRREALVMLSASAIAAILLALGAVSCLLGNMEPVRQMAAFAGVLSLMTLLTLPLIEKFLPEKG